jgi:hypothetical protein
MVVRIIKKGNSIVEKKVEPTVHKVFKVGKREPTLRQAGVIAEVGKGGQSKAQILRKNGYGKYIVRNPKKIFDSPVVKAGINPIIAKIAKNRDRIVDALSKKDFKKQSPFNLSVMMNMHNPDVNLLSGLPPDRTEYILPEEEKTRLDKLLEMNKKK